MRINPEKKEDRERVAHTLLRVTLRLASAHGFVSLGLREVSRAADIAPTSFYRHFADMEELGRELIESLAGPFVDGWLAAERTPPSAQGRVLSVAHQAFAAGLADPELMRFILAERHGAIPTFRVALAAKLARITSAIQDAIAAELPKPAPSAEDAAGAVVVLVLGACAELLDQGPEHAARLEARLAAQIRWLLSGTGVKGNA